MRFVLAFRPGSGLLMRMPSCSLPLRTRRRLLSRLSGWLSAPRTVRSKATAHRFRGALPISPVMMTRCVILRGGCSSRTTDLYGAIMATLETGDLNLPNEILDPWLGKVKYGSAVATLSNAIPMKFGKGQAITFDIGEAEHVGEGANKSGSTVTSKVQSTGPQKFQK